MSLTTTLEDAVIALLEVEFTSIECDVVALPENVAGYERAKTIPQIWVALNNSKGDELITTDYTVQKQRRTFEIILKSRTLRGDTGIYEMSDRVTKALLGKPVDDGGGILKFNQLQSNGTNDGLHDYSMYFEVPVWVIVENFDTDSLNGSILTQTTFNEN